MTSHIPSTTSAPATILIVDDHPLIREGLAMQIESLPDFVLFGEADDVATALALIGEGQPDVAIIDISLKKGNGIDLIRRISEAYPAVRILTWSMYPENLYAERALQAGAHGYLHKGRATRELLGAVRAVLAGKVYVSEELTNHMLQRAVGRKPAASSPVDLLSNRELEAFDFIGQGQTTEEIAVLMNVSPKTVETYKARIKDKLGLANFTELVHRATLWAAESK